MKKRLCAWGIESPFQESWQSGGDVSLKLMKVLKREQGRLIQWLVWLKHPKKFGDGENVCSKRKTGLRFQTEWRGGFKAPSRPQNRAKGAKLRDKA